MTSIESRVRAVIAEELALNVETLASDASLKTNLGADSMDAISLTLALEDEFGFEIPDEDAERLVTVRDVIAYITQRAGTASV